jgi:hypothetical protein
MMTNSFIGDFYGIPPLCLVRRQRGFEQEQIEQVDIVRDEVLDFAPLRLCAKSCWLVAEEITQRREGAKRKKLEQVFALVA